MLDLARPFLAPVASPPFSVIWEQVGASSAAFLGPRTSASFSRASRVAVGASIPVGWRTVVGRPALRAPARPRGRLRRASRGLSQAHIPDPLEQPSVLLFRPPLPRRRLTQVHLGEDLVARMVLLRHLLLVGGRARLCRLGGDKHVEQRDDGGISPRVPHGASA